MTFEKCSQVGCNEIPVVKIHWPGVVPPPKYCLEHAVKAKAIVEYMGCPVTIEPYEPKLIKEKIMQPFEPETVETHKTRLAKALERVWKVSEAHLDRPTLHREYIFDFHCGLRLGISKDDLEIGEEPYIHISSSYNDYRATTMKEVVEDVRRHWHSIGGAGFLRLLGISPAMIPHFVINMNTNNIH